MSLGEQVRKKRIKQGLTVRALADLISVSSPTISRLENHRTKPDPLTLSNIESWLNDETTFVGKTNAPSVRNWLEQTNLRLARIEKSLKGSGIKLAS